MKRIRTFGIFLILLAALLTGCSMDNLAEQGVELLDKLFAGDSSESRLTIGQKPASDSKPAAQEPEGTQYPEAS